MSPRKPATPAAPKEWRREAAGSYRSSDGRFTLEGGGAGSWYLRDDAVTDELGLPRTTGPYATLAEARAAAAEARSHAPEPSPLAGRIDTAANSAERARQGRTRSGPPKPDALPERPAPPASALSTSAPPASAPPKPARPKPVRPKPAPRRTWLETLDAEDREGARRARELIRDLESIGLSDADGLVRRDVLGGQPEIAARLLSEALRRVATSRLSAGQLLDEARVAGLSVPDSAEAFAARVVARTLEIVLEVITRQERLSGAPSALPGWELVERGPGRRRIRLLADDLP